MENRYYQQPIDAVLIDNDLNAQVCNDELNLSVNEALLVDSPSVHYNKDDNKSFSEKLLARKNIGLENVQNVLLWSDENHPNTLSGYSITDAYINNKQVVLGSKILTTCDDLFYVHTDNNFDDTHKNKLLNIEDNAQVNVIEEILVNNVKLNPDQDKVVRITMPTKVSEFENDKNYQTAQEVSLSISEHNLSTNSHNDIRQSISDETTARTEADEQLSTAIENESSARTEEEQRLSEALQTETTQRLQADEELTTSITDEVNTRSLQYTSLNDSIQTETESRISGDSNLQSLIDAITSKSDVVDVVGTYAELEAYTKPIYKDDIVKVLVDETHNDAITYYRLTTDVEPTELPEPPYTWTYIGASGPYYTKSETDLLIGNAIGALDYISPTADGSDIQFIDTVSQIDGLISATKKSVRLASTSQTGVVQLSNATDSESESTAATSKALKNVATNAGKIDSIEFNGVELPIENKKVSIDESDPIFESSPAYSINSTDISNWNNKAEVSDIPTKVSEFENDAGYTKVEDNHLNANGTIKIDNTETTVYDDSDIRQTLAGFNKGYVINGESDINGDQDPTTGNWSNVTEITGITLSELKVGDNVYLKDDTKPDFWVSQISPSVSLNTLDTKTDLSNYYNKTEVNGLLASKQDVIDASNKLSASLVSDLATVATSGSYNDLDNKPTIPTVDVDKSYVDTELAKKVDKVTGKGLSTNDYTNEEKNKLAGIASGAEVNVQSDWNITNSSSDAYIKNKPNLATVATSGSYSDLTSKWSVVDKEVIPEPIGGRIYYDDGDNGAIYTFYDASGNVITDVSISSLANAVSYSINGTPTKDRFYVYDNTTHTTGGISASNGLVYNLRWGWYGTLIGSSGVPPYQTNTIGSGKLNTNAVLKKGVPTDYKLNIWAYIKACNDNNLNGCNDWYINSNAEQDELIASGLVTWYSSSSNYMWSSVEHDSDDAYRWDYGHSDWRYSFKYAQRCCFAGRSF